MSTMNSLKDLYEILQVHSSAEPEVISFAYRHIAKKLHPDVAPEHLRTDYEEQMKQLNEAYDILSDEQTRRDYDLTRPETKSQNYQTEPDKFLIHFECAAVLAEVAAAAQVDPDVCYDRSVQILHTIIQESHGTQTEYEALMRMAEIQYKGLLDYKAAAETLQALAQRTTKGPELDDLLLGIVDCHYKSEQWSQCLIMCDRIIEECTLPEAMVAARINKGDALNNLHRYHEAAQAFGLVVTTYPGTDEAAYAQYNLARVLDSGLHCYPEAIEAYRAVLHQYGASSWAQDCQWRIEHIQRKHIDKKAWWE